MKPTLSALDLMVRALDLYLRESRQAILDKEGPIYKVYLDLVNTVYGNFSQSEIEAAWARLYAPRNT